MKGRTKVAEDTIQRVTNSLSRKVMSFGIVRDSNYEGETRWEIWRFIDGEKEGFISSFYDYGRAELMARRYNKGIFVNISRAKHTLEEDHFWESIDTPGFYKCTCGMYSHWDRTKGERIILQKVEG